MARAVEILNLAHQKAGVSVGGAVIFVADDRTMAGSDEHRLYSDRKAGDFSDAALACK